MLRMLLMTVGKNCIINTRVSEAVKNNPDKFPITTGGGGMIVTDNEDIAIKAKHLTTTAKQPHPWEFNHDCVGYNYRMSNINAAVGCAQMEVFAHVLENNRQTAQIYCDFFQDMDTSFFLEPANARYI